ncbi:hypothetical protein WYO_5450 [Methylobacterium sp. GXF4]|uniref:hypothetical protein n=1 Tax=Methylobacterium sp. GXF4 TaxID=1096546 RepID=UPI000269A9F2|nr:hypothetical protein [Methylobacterium sp. GXF4]EIZ81862.1 hypothetical protein WYO_5450 [Methylobacterium sp. GXF4]
MSIVGRQNDTISLDEVRDLTEALAGAFAEGVDLGPRGPQIRLLGQALETMVHALQAELTRLRLREDSNGAALDLEGIVRLARAAGSYGISEAQ